MTQPRKCPRCGDALPSNAPSGICPKCLLQAGLETEEPPRPSADPHAATLVQDDLFGVPTASTLAPHFPDLEIGDLLGQGGMGVVYKARQTRLDRDVALKIVRPESAADPAFAERFNREARTLARLNHPNIVAVYDFGDVTLTRADGAERTMYYFLMEYVDGVNLRELLQTGDLPPDAALSMVSQVCDALQFAHDEGIVHRDIKPENILVDTRGRVKIADFGLAKLVTEDATDYTLTGTHQVMGTPRYMAPEQMEATHAVDHRADIYSLGVVFYEMLTGELPLGRFQPPSQRAAVDAEWDEVVLRALEKEPARRYQNASEVKTEVQKVSETGSGVGAGAGVVAGAGADHPANATAHVQSVDAGSPGAAGVAEPRSIMRSPHWGFLMLGGAMVALGLPLLTLALMELTKMVFAWIGLGLSLGGISCGALAFARTARLPAGTRPEMSLLIFGVTMCAIGAGLMLIRVLGEAGVTSIHPRNVFTWIGIGLVTGGGGLCFAAWESGRSRARRRNRRAHRGPG